MAENVIEAQAPGKFIISGEYSVVFNKPAIATAIDAKTTVRIEPNPKGMIELNLKNLGCSLIWKPADLESCKLLKESTKILEFDDELVKIIEKEAMENLEYEYHNKVCKSYPDKQILDAAIGFLLIHIGLNDCFGNSNLVPLKVLVDSDIPVGAGMGSSSAYSVSLIGALNKFHDDPLDLASINKWAFNIDKYFHGKPSGVDNSTISYGGYILFQNGKIIGSIDQTQDVQVLLIDTKESRSTKTMGATLKLEREKDPTRTENIFNEISRITMDIWNKMIEQGSEFDPRSIDDCLRSNHTILEELGVGHPKLTHIKEMARNHGFVAKLTGAGCGGNAFVLFKRHRDLVDIKKLQQECQNFHYATRICPVGCSGLSVKVLN